MTPAFKTCSVCGAVWATRRDFLADPEVVLCGYQPDFEDLDRGLFLFTHDRPGCGTTFAIPVAAFADLVPRPILSARLNDPDNPPAPCCRGNGLGPCPMQCECAFVRDVLRIIRK